MNPMDIAFPNLGVYLRNVPKSFPVFGFEMKLYGVIIAAGILAGILLASHEAKKAGLNPEICWDFALYAVPLCVIGARIYYVIFSWDNYREHLWQIFHIRNGGMAIYGAVIAGLLFLPVYGKYKKIHPLLLGDVFTPGLVMGQVIGRWGNFTNREAFGDYTDGLFAMRLPVEAVRARDITDKMAQHIVEGSNTIQVHPTFLYESLWNLLLLLVMLFYERKKKFRGELCLLYLGGYGLGRAFIEGIRTDQLLLGGTGIPVSQLLSIGLVVVAAGIDIVVRYQKAL